MAVLKRENPYTPGAGHKPPTLAGRDGDLEGFQSLLERLAAGAYERSLIYSGLRGVGKTVLLMELDVLASEAGWASTDVQEVGSQPDFRVTFARMATRLLREMSRRHRIEERVRRALGVVKAFSVVAPAGVQFKLDVEAAAGIADSGDSEQDLTDLVAEIGEVARATGAGALFLIDEMHNLDSPSLAAICIAFQAVSRKSLPVALVGAGLPDLQARLMSAKPYADRLFAHHELGRLTDAAARAALVQPAASRGVDLQEQAARQVVREAAGYPYFLQEYGLELWNHAESSPITLADVQAVHEIVTDSLARNFFGTRFQLATDAEQRYLAAMASLGEPPYGSGEVARAYGAKDQRGVSIIRDALIGKGLIWAPRRGKLDFTVPLFDEYLRESHPLASFAAS
ncbi:MAG TPA: ATP-binding protein [Solirubrobacteraceae bacterium]|nr:ATP-binding protein [Solirubrobacteraceae bacterium]